MIQNSVRTSLYGLIGWRQSTVTGMPTIDANNLATSSGLFFQDFSSLVTIQNIYMCQEDTAISDANFNTFLANLTKASIHKVLTAVFNQDDFIENKVLFSFENVWTETLTNDVSFVGYEIAMPKRKDFSWNINKVFTSFNYSDTLTLYLFHSSKNAAISSKDITLEELTDTATDLNWNLSQFDYAGGKYYIGYLRADLTALAINRNWDKANIRTDFKTLGIEPIKVPDWDSDTLFDIDDITYVSDTFGLNFDITAWKDYSNVIVQNKNKFVNAIGYQVAADVLNLILKSTQSNRIERIMNNKVLYELDGFIGEGFPRSVGILKKLKNEIEDLQNNFVNEPLIQKGTIE